MASDSYGNVYWPGINNTASTVYLSNNTSPWTIAGNSMVTTAATAINFNGYPMHLTLDPNMTTLQMEGIVDSLFEKMVTTVKPGEKVVICIDSDFIPQHVQELAEVMGMKGIDGIIVPGARAGIGLRGSAVIRPEDERVDVLARIGEIWEQRPDLKLTDLLSWYAGESMEDGDFASAVEVHFAKVENGGIHSSP